MFIFKILDTLIQSTEVKIETLAEHLSWTFVANE